MHLPVRGAESAGRQQSSSSTSSQHPPLPPRLFIMTIILREVSDTDIARACEIESLAYKDNPLNPILSPGPFPSGASQQRIQQITEMRKNDPTAHYMQAFDDVTGGMVAWAKWHIFETTKAADASFKPLRLGPGMNPKACKIYFEGMADKRKAVMANRPYICTLACCLCCGASRYLDTDKV
jgi:hypothetical protein